MTENCQAEQAAPTHIRYSGAEIKDITVYCGGPKHPTHIVLCLLDGTCIEISPSLDTCKRSITAQLDVSRGGWVE